MKMEQNGEIQKNQDYSMTLERRKRIDCLKKIIVRAIVCMILFPTVGCIFLGVRLYQKDRFAKSMTERISFLEKALQKSVEETDRLEALLEAEEEIEQEALSEQVEEIIPEEEEIPEEDAAVENESRKVYLTFDDGPSIYTEELLDILAQYDVKATFFVTGKGKEGYGDTYRRIVEEGHTLGMHSYSHEYSNIYESLENFEQDFGELQNFLYNETGIISRYYRFPGGSSNQVSSVDIHEMTDYLDAMDITYFDWNISAGDANSNPVSSEEIVNRVMDALPSHQVAVVLMHDAANKRSTVDALPELIEKIQALETETEILPITEETMLIQHALSE